MGVAGDSQRHVGADDLPDGGYQMVLAGADLFHIAGTVQMQIDAVQILQVVAHSVQDGLLDVVKAGLFHHTAAGGVCTDHGHQFNVRVVEHVSQLHVAQCIPAIGDSHVGQVALHIHVFVGFQLKFCNKDLHAFSSSF